MNTQSVRRMSAMDLLRLWGVDTTKIASAYYSSWGNWWQAPRAYPCALVDPHGYVIVQSEGELRSTAGLVLRRQLNCPRRLSNLPNYVRCVVVGAEGEAS